MQSHNLHSDDIKSTIYNMAAVDFTAFYTLYIPGFLARYALS